MRSKISLAYNLDCQIMQISFAWPHARSPGHPDWRSWPPYHHRSIAREPRAAFSFNFPPQRPERA